jgi:hypothetical protein
MGIVDIALMALLTSFAFIVGYCMRGLFVDVADDDWPVIERPSDQHERPRRNERI